VWPRWRKRRDVGDLAELPWDGLTVLDGMDDLLGWIGAIVIAVIVISAVVLFLLPLLAFAGELLLLPFVALLFRGRRVVEARNESTGERLRYRVHSREEARERERQLACELGTAPSLQDAVRALPPATS
jgi:hypothetical protein